MTCGSPWLRFIDRDAFARFAGIGIGCQQFQAAQVLDIQVGPDHTANISDPQSGEKDSVKSGVNGPGDDVGGDWG